jgi:hypothetical protein
MIRFYKLGYALSGVIRSDGAQLDVSYIRRGLTGILTSSFSNPSLPVILTLNVRDQIPEKGPLELSAP